MSANLFTKELTPLLSSTPRSRIPVKLIVHGALLFAIAIMLGYIMVQVTNENDKPLLADNNERNVKLFRISAMTPSLAWIGYDVLSQIEYNHTDYMHAHRVFAEYPSFEEYEPLNNTMDRGIHNTLYRLVQWIVTASNRRRITSFNTEWQYVASTQMQQPMVSVLESETTFDDKELIQYLQQLTNEKDVNYTTLLSMAETFGNNEFNDIDIEQLLQQEIQSFGAGIGLGVQIYCNDDLIFDAGAGGGGGYNTKDSPNTFECGGGGGIQINNISMGGNVSMGGGTGYEYDPNQYILDPNADPQSFYGVQVPYFNSCLIAKSKCQTLSILSGGGSGAGFTTTYNDTNLVSWAYYSLNMTLV
eukprot:169116_1